MKIKKIEVQFLIHSFGFRGEDEERRLTFTLGKKIDKIMREMMRP